MATSESSSGFLDVSRGAGGLELKLRGPALSSGRGPVGLALRLGAVETTGRFGVEAGLFTASEERTDEAGITGTVGVASSGLGLAFGLYMQEHKDDAASRAETGAALRAARSPKQTGLDLGTYTAQFDSERNKTNRMGLTVNADVSPGQLGADAGVFRQEEIDGDETGRVEGGATLNAKFMEGERSLAAGEYFEDARDDREIGRTETGVRLRVGERDGLPRPDAFFERTIGTRVVGVDRLFDG